MQVGFVGLGKMGQPMVERLLAAGHTVHIFNRSPGPMEELKERGAKPAGSAQAVARQCEVFLSALPTPGDVTDVYEEVATVARPGQYYADHSTVAPRLSQYCATLVEQRGAHFLDAPVSGGPRGATTGTLTVMVGGCESDFQQIFSVLRAFGQNIKLCGPVGAGQVVKLVNQLLVGIHTAAIAEAAVFGAKLGADPNVVLDLVSNSFGGSVMLERNLPRFISRDFSGATPVRLVLKDLGLIHEESSRAGVPLLLGAIAEQRFVEARSRGFADEDMAVLVKLWEGPAGVTVHGESD
jgi:3-hydroxyisobutyrate dehydrogenase-like beta-hydroxyacid dehydrogenase